MLQRKALCKCLSIIMIGSGIKANKKYYPQNTLEECKYVQGKKKNENYTDEDLEKSNSIGETESDFNSTKCLIACVNRTLLGFYLCQPIYL